MKNLQFAFAIALVIFFGVCCTAEATEPASPAPNVIIFYVDDLGWQDVELNDLDDPCPYETPNIKKLANSGMNFTQAYSPAPTCSPSRAGIITGQHPAKIKLTHVDLGSTKPARDTDRLIAPYLQSHLDLDRKVLRLLEPFLFPARSNRCCTAATCSAPNKMVLRFKRTWPSLHA